MIASRDPLAAWGEAHDSPLDRIASERRAAGLPIHDLVTANPHEHGLLFPERTLAELLPQAIAATRIYHPDAKGQRTAREAIARYYAQRAVPIDPECIILTPGTSFGYFAAFRLLAPRAEVLVARPSYPLFDDLAAIAGATTRCYHLRRDARRWHLDAAEVEHQCTPHTRAIALVSPHNPTGHVATGEELHALAELCRRRNLPLIVDEVFAEFPISATHVPRPSAEEFGFPLVLTLNGFSKMLSLPGHKTAWIAVGGTDRARADRLVSSLAYFSDTFLPVHEIAQALVAPILERAETVIGSFADAYRARHRVLSEALAGGPFTIPAVEGGVYQPLLLPAESAARFDAEELLRERGVLVHPGRWYGMDEPSLVTTFVAAPPELQSGAALLCGR